MNICIDFNHISLSYCYNFEMFRKTSCSENQNTFCVP